MFPSSSSLIWATIHWALAAAAPFNSTKPPAFFLAGDSMTAVQSADGGGYGLGFLSFLKSPAWGIDYGQNGATTVSFVQGGVQGNWTAVMSALEGAKEEFEVFVPIMVGLRPVQWEKRLGTAMMMIDRLMIYGVVVVRRQRPEACCERDAVAVSDQLAKPRLGRQVRRRDARKPLTSSLSTSLLEPVVCGRTHVSSLALTRHTLITSLPRGKILLTPMSRRDFSSPTTLKLNLADQRTYTIYAARNTSTTYFDFNLASTAYISAIGNASAQTYDLACTDKTHLNAWGSVVFGRMLADLLLGHEPVVGVDETVNFAPDPLVTYFTPWFVPNATLSGDIWGGVPAYGGDCPLQ